MNQKDNISQETQPREVEEPCLMIFQGTSTFFTPGINLKMGSRFEPQFVAGIANSNPTPRAADLYGNMPNGETLSMITMAASQVLQVPTLYPPIEALASRATVETTTDVVNFEGPHLMGGDCGLIIARATLSVIQEILRGRKNFVFAAHSRGAVQAILITHEVNRIMAVLKQIALNQLQIDQLEDLLKSSPDNYVQDNLKKMNSIEPIFWQAFLEALQSFLPKGRTEQQTWENPDYHFQLFLVDPVPGGKIAGIPYIAWSDDRMYQLPDNVTHCDLFLMRDERSRMFKCIIPQKGQSTELNLRDLMGNHGTAMGNTMSQCNRELHENEEQLQAIEAVQRLTLFYLIDFLGQHKVQLEFSKLPEFMPLRQELLAYKAGDHDERKNKRLELCKLITKHRSVLEQKFRMYSYLSTFMFALTEGYDYRLIHDKNTATTSLQLYASPQGFATTEHISLKWIEHTSIHNLVRPDVSLAAKLTDFDYAVFNLLPELSKSSNPLTPTDKEQVFTILYSFMQHLVANFLRHSGMNDEHESNLLSNSIQLLNKIQNPSQSCYEQNADTTYLDELRAKLFDELSRIVPSAYQQLLAELREQALEMQEQALLTRPDDQTSMAEQLLQAENMVRARLQGLQSPDERLDTALKTLLSPEQKEKFTNEFKLVLEQVQQARVVWRFCCNNNLQTLNVKDALSLQGLYAIVAHLMTELKTLQKNMRDRFGVWLKSTEQLNELVLTTQLALNINRQQLATTQTELDSAVGQLATIQTERDTIKQLLARNSAENPDVVRALQCLDRLKDRYQSEINFNKQQSKQATAHDLETTNKLRALADCQAKLNFAPGGTPLAVSDAMTAYNEFTRTVTTAGDCASLRSYVVYCLRQLSEDQDFKKSRVAKPWTMKWQPKGSHVVLNMAGDIDCQAQWPRWVGRCFGT